MRPASHLAVGALAMQTTGAGPLPATVVNSLTSAEGLITGNDASSVLAQLLTAKPDKAPKTPDQLQFRLKETWMTDKDGSFYNSILGQINGGIVPAGTALKSLATSTDPNSGNNQVVNKNKAVNGVYPFKAPGDAPYSVPEATLRAAIFIPPAFTYGRKPPVIFVPGTGNYGFESFGLNLLKVFANVPFADPVWLNVPGAMLGDAQVNAEYVAYAVNYLSTLTHRNVNLVTWSQGGLSAQWAFTFWPSTRAVTSTLTAVSPDFHGTVEANLLCLSAGLKTANLLPCDPSVIQQQYDSDFVTTLRAHGGADAYVPTTTIYSALLDEVVQPQAGVLASSFLGDARHVGVSNVEVQAACPGRPAGSFYGHASVLYNPLTAALAADALRNGGPGQLARLDLERTCAFYITPELSVLEAVGTAGSIVSAVIRVLAYLPKVVFEPSLMPYVLKA